MVHIPLAISNTRLVVQASCKASPLIEIQIDDDVRCEADWQEPSGWPRLLGRSSFPEPCLPRTALTARVSRSTAVRAGLLSLLLALLAPAPDALVLADASPAAILARAPDALVLADASPAAILALASLALVGAQLLLLARRLHPP